MPKAKIVDAFEEAIEEKEEEEENEPLVEEPVTVVDIDENDGIDVEDMDPTEGIWEGGPTAGQILIWKKQFGDVYVSSITSEYHIVWRTMNRLEYRNHVRKVEQLAQSGQYSTAEVSLINEESVCESCILYPPFEKDEVAGQLAGVPSAIAADVLEASGFVALEVRRL